jgi:DNA-binding transcriptional MerR regulator
MAQRLGVSPKALRVYETAGLIAPTRTQQGWRAYGPAEQARLHQILTLKRLGLSLARIGELLGGKFASLDAVLALQEHILQARKLEADRALQILAAARGKLARDGVLSPDDLMQLTRETAMTKTDDQWREVFEPLAAQHFSTEEMEEIGRRKQAFLAQSGHDAESFTAAWKALLAELQALKASGDTGSPRAKELLRRWNALLEGAAGTKTPEEAERTKKIWAQATSAPQTAGRLPIQPDEFAFLQQIADGMRAAGELPPR